jgi:mono/diheme cytochrome c family protein
MTGDGRGPTGPWLNPHPRDYRKGLFKFISTRGTEGTAQPARDDLLRVLKNGVNYTSMPSFGLLPDHELEQLVSYVMHLSIRGVAEEDTMSKLLSKAPLTTVDGDELPSINDFIQYSARYAVLRPGGWADASGVPTDPSQPPPNLVATPETPQTTGEPNTDAAIRKGFEIFNSTAGACAGCHKNYGRDSYYLYDKWGTLVQPRNLTAGTLRGGRRPIDLYWRIRAGIDPAGMPKATLSDKEVWCVIKFVQALPYPNMLPPDVAQKVYGATLTAKKD